MALSDLKPTLENIALRRGSLLVRSSALGGDYFHGGTLADLKVTEEPLLQKRDEKGRQRQVAGDFTVEASLLQTAAPLARIQDLAASEVDVIVAPGPVAADTLTEADAELAGEFRFLNQHLSVGATLDYSRGQSALPIRFTFFADLTTITDYAL